VRELTHDDWEQLRALRLSALADSSEIHGDLKLEQEQPPTYWQEQLQTQHWAALVANGNDVGLVTAMPTPPDRYGDCWIKSWWIAPEYRGLGGADKLLSWIVEICIRKNWQTVGLGVFEKNQIAIRSYQRLGFVQIGGRHTSSRAGEFFIIMGQDVSNIMEKQID
jgi:ribosomal protein S18 acetylase RimI-like enzyme